MKNQNALNNQLELSMLLKYFMPSVLWHCWLGSRKGIQPGKTELSVWGEVQICTWLSWFHCHSLFLASVKSRLVLVTAHPSNQGQSPEGHKMDVCVCFMNNLMETCSTICL